MENNNEMFIETSGPITIYLDITEGCFFLVHKKYPELHCSSHIRSLGEARKLITKIKGFKYFNNPIMLQYYSRTFSQIRSLDTDLFIWQKKGNNFTYSCGTLPYVQSKHFSQFAAYSLEEIEKRNEVSRKMKEIDTMMDTLRLDQKELLGKLRPVPLTPSSVMTLICSHKE